MYRIRVNFTGKKLISTEKAFQLYIFFGYFQAVCFKQTGVFTCKKQWNIIFIYHNVSYCVRIGKVLTIRLLEYKNNMPIEKIKGSLHLRFFILENILENSP